MATAKNFTLGHRLREERERIRLTQKAWAKICDAGERTVITWERGATSPSGEQLAALAAAGADVLYIITGERNAARLSDEQQALLARYAAADEALRQAALRVLSGGAGVVIHAPGGQVAGRDIINDKRGRKARGESDASHLRLSKRDS